MSSYLLNVFNGLLMKKTLTLSQAKLQFLPTPPGSDSHLVFAPTNQGFMHIDLEAGKKFCKFLCCHSPTPAVKLVKLSTG